MTINIIEEGLKVLNSKIKSKKGYPFDLPYVKWLEKLYASQNFLKEVLIRLKIHYKNNPLINNIEELIVFIKEIFSSDTIYLIKKIKFLFAKFVQLREILSQDEKPSKQIKNQLKIFMKRLKKQSKRYPKLKIIINRLKKYWNYLFHGYDDDRLPLTNLEIERSFNSFKRSFRKRTGLKSRSSFFIMEGEISITLEPLKADRSLTKDFQSFYQIIHLHLYHLDRLEWHQLQDKRKTRQQKLKYRYHKKYSSSEAFLIFKNLRAQIKEI